ncbi:MAG: pantetheine-phosphate adenylyltransferase [archaeon]
MTKAVYPGSFDPITLGHIDIIKRALKIFDELVVLVAENSQKESFFSTDEKLDLIRNVTRGLNIGVESFSGLLVDYVRTKNIKTVVRSLRAVSDFENEFQMATVNRRMDPDFETVFLMTDKEFFFLKSSIVRELAHHRADLSPFVPKYVEERLKWKLGSIKN